MTIQLTPEQERIILEEIQSGHFHTPDEVLDRALAALRDKTRQPKSIVQFFRESPFVGEEMKFERSQDTGRKIEL
jgi:Arc/MetJ-type ribon-helix-helix transcriptional regulator